jgi:hypothetical protein
MKRYLVKHKNLTREKSTPEKVWIKSLIPWLAKMDLVL